MENSVYYERLAQLALEKNVNCLLRRMAKADESLRPKNKKLYSKYTGVYFMPKCKTNPWSAAVNRTYLGVYPTEELAHEARLKYIREHGLKIAA
jgi:hypothetical protein